MFDYENKTAHWVNRLSFLIRSEVQKRFKSAGYALTAEEWAMLMLLWGRPPMAMNALAARSLRERTTVTRLVDAMVAKELLTREPDPADRRRMMIGLTKKAEALEAPLTGIVGPLIQQLNAGLSDAEIAQTNRVLAKMEANLTAISKDAD